MQMQPRLVTWNATGILTGTQCLACEFNQKNTSVCGLSEHWLLMINHNANILDSIDKHCKTYVVTCKRVHVETNISQYIKRAIIIAYLIMIDRTVRKM